MIIRQIGMRKLARFALAALFVTSSSTIAHAAITGTIIDMDGKPVAGATIRAFAPESSAALRVRVVAGKADRDPGATAKSSDSGSFTIDLKSSPAVDLEIEASDHPRTTIATVDGDDIGVIQLAAQPVAKIRVTSGGKAVANAIILSGSEVRKTDTAGETPVFGIGSVYVVHPDFAAGLRRDMNGAVSSAHEIKLSSGVTVRGKVVNAAGPVPHAIVSINGWPLAESADDGTFVVAHAPEGWQSLTAVRGNEIGTATRPTKADAVEIRLTRGETFTGTVRDSVTGAAVAGARMSLTESADSFPATAVSDAKGRFTFGPLLSRSYQIEGMHPSYGIASAAVLVPHVTTRAFAALPVAHARGRVVDEEKKPVASAVVSSPITTGPRRPSTLTNAAGEFVIRVVTSATPSALPIYALKRGYAGGMLEARKWQPGETRSDLVITLVRGFTIPVRVRDRQHQPVAHAYVNLIRIGDGAQQGFFAPADCDEPTRQDCRRTGADGSVVFRTSEGAHNVFVTGDEVAPKRVPSVTLTARSEPVVVEVDRGVTISGRVVHADGTPVAGAIVEMPRSPIAPRNATSDSDGAFTIVGIAAGATTLTALSSDRHLTSAPVPVTAPAKNVTITMPHGGRIEGRVLDRGTKQPVTDFTVSLPSRGGRPGPRPTPQQVHADDGSYAIDNVAPGTAQIVVTATGFVTATRSDITAEEGKTVSGIDVQLDRGASITGRVTSGGAPVAGVQVSLAANRMPVFGGMTTDADGNYTIDGVAEGERTLQFQRTGFIVLHKTVEVAAGKDLRLDVELDHGAEIRGRVTDRAGHNIPGANVAITGDRSAPSNMTQTDLDGSFVMQGLATGSYRVTARKDGYVSGDANDVTVPQSQPLTFALDHGATITGRVTGLAPEDLAQVVVVASGGTSRNQTPVDSAGNFTLSGMPDGSIRVDAMLSAAGRNRTAPPKTIVVENGAAPPVELDFSEGITISGHVTHAGLAVSMGSIVFSPTPQTAQKIAAAQMGRGGGGMISPDGSYVITLLTPGDYNVRINGQSLAYQTTYTASSSGTFDVDIRGAMLRGHVVDAATGAPLANAQVIVFARVVQASSSAMTDSEGHFAIDALVDAIYDLRATREPYSVATQQVTVSGGSAPDVEVRLEQAPAVTFHVTDSVTGAPVDASIMVTTEQRTNPAQAQRVESGVLKAWLQPGNYVASTFARYYIGKTANFTTPPADVQLTLVRGGQLIIEAKSAQQVRIDQIGAGFPGPVRPGINGPYPTMPPGSYLLSVLDNSGSVVRTVPVVIVAGETTTIQLP